MAQDKTDTATRLLLVADGAAAAQLLQRHVRPRDVCVTASPEEALEALRRGERFDAIVGDILMTSMSAADFHAAAMTLDSEQAERMIFIPALEAPHPGEPPGELLDLEAKEIARRKLLRTAAYVSPALLATFVSRPARAQPVSCNPSKCRPIVGCNPHPPH